jgi:hypothetical protein
MLTMSISVCLDFNELARGVTDSAHSNQSLLVYHRCCELAMIVNMGLRGIKAQIP